MFSKIFLLVAPLLFWSNLQAQNKSGYYINWNVDHTDRRVKPSIPVSAQEAKVINCYYVKFNSRNRLESVKFFYQGRPSKYSNFGAHEMVRTYAKGHFTEGYKDIDGKSVANSRGIYKQVFRLNSKGFWDKKQYFNQQNQPVAQGKVAEVHFIRDEQNRAIVEVQLGIKGDTIPDVNGFKTPHFAFTKDGFALYRQNRNPKGKLINGDKGYAVVNFLFDGNGNFVNEEFRDEQGNLFARPDFGYAKINFREFNKYGKPNRIYFLDTMGRPLKTWAYGVVQYYPNMNRKSITFYDNQGNQSATPKGTSTIIYKYDSEGKFIGRERYDVKGKKINNPK